MAEDSQLFGVGEESIISFQISIGFVGNGCSEVVPMFRNERE